MTVPDHTIELTGLDGSNPLAFLAALGVLRCLEIHSSSSRARLGWGDTFRPTIDPGDSLDRDGLIDVVQRGIAAVAEHGTSLGNIVGAPVDDYRHFADPSKVDPRRPGGRIRMAYAAALASDAVVDGKRATVVPTALSFSNGQGGKLLLKDFRTLAGRLTADRINAALFETWQYDDSDQPTFRWDPLDMRTGAHMATNPGATDTRSVMAANALAFIGLSFLPVVPSDETLSTTAVRRINEQSCFVWPIWRVLIGPQVVAALVQRADWSLATGVFAQFAARRFKPNGQNNLYLTSSFAV